MRIRTRGMFLLEGEEKFFVRGVSYGPFRPNRMGDFLPEKEVVERDFHIVRELGANTLRLYHVPLAGFRRVAGGDVDERGQHAAGDGNAGNFRRMPGSVLGRHDELQRARHAAGPGRLFHGLVPGREDGLAVGFVGIGLAPPVGEGGKVRRGIAEQLAEALVDQDHPAVAADQARRHGRPHDQGAHAFFAFAQIGRGIFAAEAVGQQ